MGNARPIDCRPHNEVLMSFGAGAKFIGKCSSCPRKGKPVIGLPLAR